MSLEDFSIKECVMCFHLHLQYVYLEHVAELNHPVGSNGGVTAQPNSTHEV